MHGAWADGSSWAKVIGPLAAEGVRVLTALLPLTSFAEDTAAVERTLERASGPGCSCGSRLRWGRDRGYTGGTNARPGAVTSGRPCVNPYSAWPVVDITREAIGEAISG